MCLQCSLTNLHLFDKEVSELYPQTQSDFNLSTAWVAFHKKTAHCKVDYLAATFKSADKKVQKYNLCFGDV